MTAEQMARVAEAVAQRHAGQLRQACADLAEQYRQRFAAQERTLAALREQVQRCERRAEHAEGRLRATTDAMQLLLGQLAEILTAKAPSVLDRVNRLLRDAPPTDRP